LLAKSAFIVFRRSHC